MNLSPHPLPTPPKSLLPPPHLPLHSVSLPLIRHLIHALIPTSFPSSCTTTTFSTSSPLPANQVSLAWVTNETFTPAPYFTPYPTPSLSHAKLPHKSKGRVNIYLLFTRFSFNAFGNILGTLGGRKSQDKLDNLLLSVYINNVFYL